jgi:hypothetical protein
VIEDVDGGVDVAIALDAAALALLLEALGVLSPEAAGVVLLAAAIEAGSDKAGGADERDAETDEQHDVDEEHSPTKV